MLFKKEEKTPDVFWQEYEEKTGEKILSRSLGKYISGWAEFDEKKWNGIWGLLITTSGGFRFHHFPQNSWMDALTSRFYADRQIKEKTIFLPKEKIASMELTRETKWWKKLLTSSPPQLIIRYTDEASVETGGLEKLLLFEAEYNGGEVTND